MAHHLLPGCGTTLTLTLTVCKFFSLKNLDLNDVIVFLCILLQYRPCLMFAKLCDDFNLHSCVALDGFENSVCGPCTKKFVHNLTYNMFMGMLKPTCSPLGLAVCQKYEWTTLLCYCGRVTFISLLIWMCGIIDLYCVHLLCWCLITGWLACNLVNFFCHLTIIGYSVLMIFAIKRFVSIIFTCPVKFGKTLTETSLF